jgi:outer membrane protein TolC
MIHRLFSTVFGAVLALVSAKAAAQTASSLRLDRVTVIERARRNSPELLLARARVDAARAARAGTTVWARDNPTLSLTGGPRLLSNGDWIPDLIVGVSVPFEVGAISVTRPRVADAQVLLAEAEAELAAYNAVFDALLLWVRTGGALARVERSTEQRSIFEQSVRIATVRASHGAAQGNELAYATMALSQVSAALEQERAEAIAQQRALAARLGIDPTVELTIVGALDVQELPPLEQLLAELQRHPIVAVTHARAVVAQRELEALRRAVWPAPRVSLSGGRENEFYLRAGVDVGLPLFQRGENAMAVTRAQISLADAERRSALSLAEVALREAYARAVALERAGAMYDEAVRAGETVTRLAARSFELGERDATVHLTAMREAYLARRAQTEWRESRALAHLAVERASGVLR